MQNKFRIFFIAVLINIIILTIATALFEDIEYPNEDQIVYTTKTGECYHLSSCSSLSYNKFSTTLKNAVQRGYRKCRDCNSPKIIYNGTPVFNIIHYLIVVPFSGFWAAGATETTLKLGTRSVFLPILAHCAISVLLSLLFDFIV